MLFKISDNITEENLADFLNEGVTMKQFDHPNILSLIGMTILGNQPCVLMPYMEHGNLRDYLRQQTNIHLNVQVHTVQHNQCVSQFSFKFFKEDPIGKIQTFVIFLENVCYVTINREH